MAIKRIPGKGLEVELNEFVKLRAFQAGGEFWGHENQSVIREHLEEFLPRMEVQSDGKSVLAQMFVKGKEVTSTSDPATRGVPKNERKRLEKAVARLKERAADENADKNIKAIIEAFRLPDPNKDAELYRIYGSRFKPKLLVLWGCEKEPGTSIVPDEVPARIREESGGAKFVRRSPWILLLLLFCVLGYLALQQGLFDTSGSNPNELVANQLGNEKGNSKTSDEKAENEPGAPSDEKNSPDDRGKPSDDIVGTEGNENGMGSNSPDNGVSKTNGDSPGDKVATNNASDPAGKTNDVQDPPGNDGKTAGASVGNSSEKLDEEAEFAEGTPLEKENSPSDELTVEESDPNETGADANKQKPAEANLINLAKITRSAVVLIVLSDSNGKVRGSGSGFLISPDGLIATNHHVLEGSAGALVKLSNRSVFEVEEIVASSQERDLAVFKIDPKGETLPFLSLQEGPGAEVGENIAVIGSPLGLEGTFTVGIVSSTRKRGDVDFLQITAPISPGSSGSPVVNYDGKVVGVAVGAIEDGQSLNFAASVSELRELLANKSVDSNLLSGTELPLNEREPESLPKGAENGIGIISIPPPPIKEDPLTVGAEKQLPMIPSSPDTVAAAPSGAKPETNDSIPDSEKSKAPTPAFRIAQVSKNELPDGKVEVTLELRNSKGGTTEIKEIHWKLNDAAVEGAKIDGPRFTHTIAPGDHALSVSAVTKSGEEVNIHATMNIEIEVSSAIEIRQLEEQ
ncbi:MAG: trypsin-like peptidase domain-containing protein [Verrucomicrobiae bacterium]|nr:trypsin-like peptidase domain-containing protein [Verrucomicrobiae bacterium]